MQHVGNQAEMKRRYLAGELTKALRQGDRHWYPISIENDPEPELFSSGSPFRIVGAGGRGANCWADYHVLRWRTRTILVPAEPMSITVTPHKITLSEPAYDILLAQLEHEDEGIYCGECEGRKGAAWTLACCEFNELMVSPHALFTLELDRLRRNQRYVTKEAVQIALRLLNVAQLFELA